MQNQYKESSHKFQYNLSLEGIVFDIHRFSTHHGPGSRMVFYLKGCPLKCLWCCDPESQSKEPQLSFIKDRCTNCFQCIEHCPEHALIKEGEVLKVNFRICTACGNCIAKCPEDALKIIGWKMTSDEIIEMIKKDDSYSQFGGAITLTGGEPLEQFEFTLDILKQAKANNINTCIETSGYALEEKFERILPFVDLFFFDYKITDTEIHERFVKVENTLIFSNLEYLYKKNANIILRCPIIPGINDTFEHIVSIYKLEKRMPKIHKILLIPYHNDYLLKYKTIGKSPFPIASKSFGEKEFNDWYEQLKMLGSEKVEKCVSDSIHSLSI